MAKGDINGKRIPKSVIFRHFLTLPEEQRVKLLQAHLSADLIDRLGEKNSVR